MRSEQFFFVLFLFLFFVLPIKQVFPPEKLKVKDAFFEKKKLNLLKLSYPTYIFVKVDNSKD